MTLFLAFLIAVLTGATCAVLLAAWLASWQRRLEAQIAAIAALVALIRGNAGVSGEQKGKNDASGSTGWPGARS